jgi:hypothetical protein
MMEEILILSKSGIITDRIVRTNFNDTRLSSQESINNPVVDRLISEGGENFFYYLRGLGLADDPNIMVLSSRRNYYYDYRDLKGITTLINLKRLNRVKHLDSFLYTVCNSLSPKSNFIGCFSNWRTTKSIEFPPKRYNGFFKSSDSGTEIEIDENDVSRLLESHWFKVIDMTEFNGLTYFRAQNNKKIFN